MKKRLFQVQFFALLLVATISCTDHEIQKRPVIETGNLIWFSNHTSAFWIFAVNFVDLGNVPVVEYGVVYAKELPADGLTVNSPGVSVEKFTEPQIPVLGNVSQPNLLVPMSSLYYRAYAKLSDNTYIYGSKTLYFK